MPKAEGPLSRPLAQLLVGFTSSFWNSRVSGLASLGASIVCGSLTPPRTISKSISSELTPSASAPFGGAMLRLATALRMMSSSPT